MTIAFATGFLFCALCVSIGAALFKTFNKSEDE